MENHGISPVGRGIFNRRIINHFRSLAIKKRIVNWSEGGVTNSFTHWCINNDTIL